jgi:hypothetical protein
MATAYTYEDAFLAPRCTEEREDRAVADVALLGAFSAAWTERLVKTQTYILACRENQSDAEDLYGVKLKTYSAAMAALLPQAQRAAAEAADEISGTGFFSVPLERA